MIFYILVSYFFSYDIVGYMFKIKTSWNNLWKCFMYFYANMILKLAYIKLAFIRGF